MKNKKRAIVIRFDLDEYQKKKLRKEARERGYKGLRELLRFRGTSDLF